MPNPRHEIPLPGCTPTPMASYLKALGVLRVLADPRNPQGDRLATAFWRDEMLIVRSRFPDKELVSCFLEGYQPSSIVDPWNGGSGFYPKDNREAILAITQGNAPRFKNYREAIRACMELLERLGIQSKVDSQTKPALLEACRNSLPDEALDWLDAAFLLTEDGPKYPPLLGTGGNDGRLDFPNNFMQRLCEVFDPETGQPHATAESLLREALWEETTDELNSKGAVGQFDPGGAGGANSIVGFSGKTLLNPWNYVLMLEGAMVFASAAVKKLEARTQGTLAFPFCVRSSGVGYGSASVEDEQSARAEMWLPLWEHPATLSEIHSLFAEGRAQVHKRPAKNAVDFARALATYGVDRGISEFVRYGFHQRNGLAYFAVPLNRFRVQGQPEVNLIQTVDSWLDRFRRGAATAGAPSRAGRALRRLDSAILELCQRKGSERVQDVVVALGEAEAVLARSTTFRENNFLQPLVLDPGWLTAMDDESVEFRLAASLAGIWDKRVGAFREQLEPVEIKGSQVRWLEERSYKVVWGLGGLLRNLTAVLQRRVVDAIRQGPAEGKEDVLFPGRSPISASLGDIQAFLEGQVDLVRLEALLKGFALLDWSKIRRDGIGIKRGQLRIMPSGIYALLKLTHLPFPLKLSKDKDSVGISIRLTPSISRLAVAERVTEATNKAIQRLRSSGVPPVLELPTYIRGNAERLSASLLYCISTSDARFLARRLVETDETEEDTPQPEIAET